MQEPLRFGHTAAELAFWRRLATRSLKLVPSPCYVFSVEPLRRSLSELERHAGHLGTTPPVRHWLSCKTQPFPPLLRWWRNQGRPIEVVSEFEFLLARKTGFAPENILVNGPAKHHWLPQHPLRGLSVNFDSLAEIKALLPLARRLDWRVGIRLHTTQEFNPEHPEHPTQFGFTIHEAPAAIRQLQRAKAQFEILHVHLRTNVSKPSIYQAAIEEAAELCRQTNWMPKHLDCGGGWPPRHTLSTDGVPYAASFDYPAFRNVMATAARLFPGLQEIWLENGRFFSAPGGALVVKVLDVKERGAMRQLICNGGRTLNALISNWEQHEILCLPSRAGRSALTAVCGPTCMAFDQLGARPLPKTTRAGDHLLWLDAGAYHLPWETRFSHGLAAVVWHDADGRLSVARQAETFERWWRGWSG